jgi:hypothetical protein
MERHLRYDAEGDLAELEKIGAPSPALPERVRRSTLFRRDKMGRLLS